MMRVQRRALRRCPWRETDGRVHGGSSMAELTGPSKARLATLLREYNEFPERQEETDAQIHEEFCKLVSIMVMDSCGFSRSVRQHGIVNYLARLERLSRMVVPLIEGH